MLILSIVLAGMGATTDQDPASPGVTGEDGIRSHAVRSEYQAGPTVVRVLLPDRLEDGERLPVVYVLPVEAGTEHRYGDGLTEIRRLGLHRRHRAVFVAPTFSALPWYADHPTDPAIRQESHLLRVVLPLVERTYPVRTDHVGRLLLGFSKSGWGAYSLLLRHPEVFGKALAWDAPLMLDQPGKYGSGEIFGSAANFAAYRVSRLLAERAEFLRRDERLVLTGYDNFREDHRKAHELMLRLGIRHVDRDGPRRPHDWHGGWVAEAVDLLLRHGRAVHESNDP